MRTVKLTKESTKDILENLLKRSPNNYGKFESTVAQILDKVKNEGDAALFAYTKEFDKADVTKETIRQFLHTLPNLMEQSLLQIRLKSQMQKLKRLMRRLILHFLE